MSENLEDYPSTNDGGYDFVQQIFKNMGGQVRPPNRPNKSYRLTLKSERMRDAFMRTHVCSKTGEASHSPQVLIGMKIKNGPK